MIRRSRREGIYELLENHTEWNIIDVASSDAGWKYANVFTDIRDLSEYYNKKYNGEKKFVRCDVENLPFKDNEFDFVIASHILEHVKEPENFCRELSRIGKRGYIEVPTPLWDNLIDGAKFIEYGHKWWITFDDVDNFIVINKKINIVDRFLSMEEHNLHMAWFRDSILTQLYWEDDIQIKRGSGVYTYNNNRNIDFKYDSNNIDWNNNFLFKFGSK